MLLEVSSSFKWSRPVASDCLTVRIVGLVICSSSPEMETHVIVRAKANLSPAVLKPKVSFEGPLVSCSRELDKHLYEIQNIKCLNVRLQDL